MAVLEGVKLTTGALGRRSAASGRGNLNLGDRHTGYSAARTTMSENMKCALQRKLSHFPYKVNTKFPGPSRT